MKKRQAIRFFPAFPVHRCRGVSFNSPTTGEKVCVGQFDEGAGILLVSPDILDRLTLASRSPFFDGFVLRQMSPKVVYEDVNREVSAFLAAAAKLGKGEARSGEEAADKEKAGAAETPSQEKGNGQEAKTNSRGSVSPNRKTGKRASYVKSLSGSLTTPQQAAPILTELEQTGRCSVPVQFIEFTRGKEKDLNLCVGDCYWLGMKIPLQACNPFLVSRQEGILEYYTGAPSSRSASSPPSLPESPAATEGGTMRNPRGGDRRMGPVHQNGDENSRNARTNVEGEKGKGDNQRKEDDELGTYRDVVEELSSHVMEMCKRAAEVVPNTVASVAGKVQEAFPRSTEEAMDRGKSWVELSQRSYKRLTTHAKSSTFAVHTGAPRFAATKASVARFSAETEQNHLQ
ncbi:conserved hypothetical protein [Neospora caninum Liverpool]|uniref:Uncharacterized protein n=1 Tax=Neospora caninum (strain Liverpool) TaxID=572307 RepID=F0VMN1_NEOCL|nr:conserved hypothetical protein [Neospora caninum Liverpool]CBZ54977.1 conserved hypothetical protein [Neospora caninum Liverpool]|eukprot:XP_003885005.1 conserved hypothetical protein [Neospora caninum Liverpool]